MKNPIIKGHLNAIRAKFSLNDFGESDLFEIYSINSILCGQYLHRNLKPLEIYLGGHEVGIDGIGIIIQGVVYNDLDDVQDLLQRGKDFDIEVHIFQSTTSSSFDTQKFTHFLSESRDFFDTSYISSTQTLLEKKEILNDIFDSGKTGSGPKLFLHYSYTGGFQESSSIKAKIKSSKASLRKLNIFSEVEIQIYDADMLKKFHSKSQNSFETEITLDRYINLPEHSSVNEAFLGYISGDDLLRIITVEGAGDEKVKINSGVFFDNIRDDLEKSQINKSIREELNSGLLEDFIFKNNGVTVVSRKLKKNSSKFRIIDYQVVNGCQTSNILFKAKHQDELSLEGIFVPFRLIVCDDQKFISSVIIGTNKQNPVTSEQLMAFSPLLKDLEEYGNNQKSEHRLHCERRANQYSRDSTIDQKKIYSLATLLRSVAALYYHRPDLQSRYRVEFYEPNKDFLFGEDHEVQMYHAAALLHHHLLMLTKSKGIKNDKAYLFYVLFAIGLDVETKSEDLVARRKNSELNKKYQKLTELALNEKKLQEYYGKVEELVSASFKKSGKGREMLRDFLRNQKTTREFLEKWNPLI